jgi:ATP-dependent Clp protease protease subunit
MAPRKEQDNADIFQRNRIIYFNGAFTENKVQEVVRKLLEFNVTNPNKDIVIFIDSNGGLADSFIAIHDTIKMISSDVATVCLGKAMSSGMLLLMSGVKGKRFITKNSRVLIHELSAGTIGKISNMNVDVKESQRIQDVLEKLVVEYTDIKKEDVRDLMEKDTFCNAETAKELGIVDYIVESYEEIFSKLNI